MVIVEMADEGNGDLPAEESFGGRRKMSGLAELLGKWLS